MSPWDAFVKDVLALGFEVIARRRFDYRNGPKPELVLLAHPTKKLILSATSYLSGDNEIVNGGELYGTVFLGPDADEKRYDVFVGCSHAPAKDGKVEFSCTIRDNVARITMVLERIETASGEFVNWGDPDRYLWFLDYSSETKTCLETDRDLWRTERDRVLATAPASVRDFITSP